MSAITRAMVARPMQVTRCPRLDSSPGSWSGGNTQHSERSLGVYWARLKLDGNYAIRRGAWYRVTQFGKENVILEVPGTVVSVPRIAVELVGMPPRRWTVVPRPPGDTWLPEAWGQHYGVCPGCHHRAPLLTVPQMLRCPRCSDAFPVAWNESYLRR